MFKKLTCLLLILAMIVSCSNASPINIKYPTKDGLQGPLYRFSGDSVYIPAIPVNNTDAIFTATRWRLSIYSSNTTL